MPVFPTKIEDPNQLVYYILLFILAKNQWKVLSPSLTHQTTINLVSLNYH